jgi:hypothetical protein
MFDKLSAGARTAILVGGGALLGSGVTLGVQALCAEYEEDEAPARSRPSRARRPASRAKPRSAPRSAPRKTVAKKTP